MKKIAIMALSMISLLLVSKQSSAQHEHTGDAHEMNVQRCVNDKMSNRNVAERALGAVSERVHEIQRGAAEHNCQLEEADRAINRQPQSANPPAQNKPERHAGGRNG